MKNPHCVLCLLLAAGTSLWAQTPREQPPVTLAPPAAVHRAPEELDRLLGPIALYPDALIALILPAATASTDIVLAARYLRDNPNDLSQVENRAWDDSVKSLTHYPEILRWMDENLTWTKQVGEAFIEEPAEVMKTIQRLRARARAAGTLVDTPQQQVLSEADVLRIVPTQPDIIYVPRYEPAIVFGYRPSYYSQPLMTFGLGFSVGPWLAYDCDWRQRTIWVGNRHRSWHGHDWRRPVVPIQRSFFNPAVARPWRPPARPPRPAVAPTYYSRGQVAEPTPLPDAPRPAPRAFANRGLPAGTRVAPAAVPPTSDPAAPGVAPESVRQHSGPRGARLGLQPGAAAPVASPARPPENGTTVHRGPRPDRHQETTDRRTRTFPSVTVNSLPAQVAPPLPTVAPLMPARPNPAPRPERSHPRSTPAPAVAPPQPNAAPPPTAAPAPQPPAPPPQTRTTPSPAQGDRNERRGRYNEP
ncbi:MAG: DUF3300 domain-containing protein [Verrucomicrobia bacterium]|nr:DUF3300 domain-containing protein [Verrucomicrobiota bacterium]